MSANALQKKLLDEVVNPTSHVPKKQLAAKRVALIVPVHNEEKNIQLFLNETREVFTQIKAKHLSFEYIFINDGSTDGTLATLVEAQVHNDNIKVVDLSRNFGKEAALTAGLDHCDADAAIPIDVDLQDPPSVIAQLVEKWLEGHPVVVAERVDRSADDFMKRRTAQLFYRVHNAMAPNKIPENVGDFRLMDRRALDALNQLPERRRFMKGLFAWIGFETATVQYVREARAEGETKFSGWKLWNLALEGITSFSNIPLEIWSYIGGIISALSFAYGGYIVIDALFFGNAVPGYASLMASMLFLGGVQLIGIGVLGQYLGRVYSEVKQRPIYLVRSVYKRED